MHNPGLLGDTAQIIVEQFLPDEPIIDEFSPTEQAKKEQQFFLISHKKVHFGNEDCEMITVRNLTPDLQSKLVLQ